MTVTAGDWRVRKGDLRTPADGAVDGASCRECDGSGGPSRRSRLVALAAGVGVLVALIAIAGGGTAAGVDLDASDLPGNGTEADPYEISNASELQAMEHDLGANYTLVDDVDASDTSGWRDGLGFDPIGASNGSYGYDAAFTGSLDGRGHEISGLVIDHEDIENGDDGVHEAEYNVGLFVATEDATVENLTIDDAYVEGFENVGILAGQYNGSVTNVHVTGKSMADSGHNGGLVGISNGTISDASADVNTTARTGHSNPHQVGGLVGRNDGTMEHVSATGNVTAKTLTDDEHGGLVGVNRGSIDDARASGNVSAGENVGGLVGDNEGAVTNASASGDVEGSDAVGGLIGSSGGDGSIGVADANASGDVSGQEYVGGLVGQNGGSVIERSFAAGSVTGTIDTAGGLVGRNAGNALITETYATGSVNGTLQDSDYNDDVSTGGLVGQNDDSNVTASYANGTVAGTDAVGGLVGMNVNDANISHAYAAGEIDGDSSVGGLVGANGGSFADDSTVTESYWDEDATNQSESDDSPAEDGLTTAEMTGTAAESNMTAFDFQSVWKTTSSYPELRMGEAEPDPTVTGFVTAPSGATLAAAVQLRDAETNESVDEGVTNSDGRYDLEAPSEGTYDLIVDAPEYEPTTVEDLEVAGEETTRDIELEPQGLLVTIEGTNAPVTEGETLTVTAAVENADDETAQETIELLDVGDGVLDSATVGREPGENETIELTWDTASGDAGTHAVTVAGEGNSDTAQVVVDSADPAAFEVELDATNSPVTEGETLDVNATVENVGSEAGSETVELLDSDGEVVDTADVNDLEGGETESIDLAWETDGDDVGATTLTVETDDDAAAVSVEVEAVDLGVTSTPTSPEVGDTVTFYAWEAENPTWEFEDGSTAYGQLVFHEFTSFGSQNVTVTDADGFEETVEVDVSMPTLELGEYEMATYEMVPVEREYGGTPLAGVPWEEEFTVETRGNVTVDRVEFELDGDTIVDDDPEGENQTTSATFDLGELDGDAPLTVTVVDEEGGETEWTEMVRVNQPPQWLADAINEDVEVDQRAGEIETDLSMGQMAESFDLDIPVDVGEQTLGGSPAATVTYDTDAPAATVYGDGEFSTDMMATSVTAGAEVEGSMGSDLALQEARLASYGEVEDIPGPVLGVKAPVVGTIGLEMTIDGRLAAEADLDSELDFEEGTVGAGADVNVRVTINVVCEVYAEGSGGADVVFDVPGDPDTRGEVFVGVGVGVGCGAFEKSAEKEFPYEFNGGVGDSPIDDLAEEDEDDPLADAEWELASAEGERPLVGDDGTASIATAASASGANGADGSPERLTNRSREDTEPAVAAVGDDRVVIWSALDDGKNVTDGRDLHARTYDAANETWSDTEALTDDLKSDEDPTIATNGDAVLAVWSRLNETIDADEVDGPGDTFPHYEIAYAIDERDGDGWSDPAVLTDTADMQFRPDAVPTADGWLLAWESAELDNETVTGSDVRYADVDGAGVAGTVSTIENATLPSVGLDADEPTLAYATRDENGTDEIVTDVFDGDGFDGEARTERHRHDAGTTTSVATDGGRTIWANGTAYSRLYEADDGGASALDLREGVTGVTELDLESVGDESVLSYRARTAEATGQELVYRLDRGDGWIRDRAHAGVDAANHTVWHSDVTPASDEEGFHAAYAVQPLDWNATNDVFVSDHEFRPAFDLNATASNADAGEESTVEYDLRNVGDIETADGVTVVLENESGPVGEVEHDTIEAGESVSGSLDGTVDESGTFDVRVDHEETALDGTETVSVAAATPALSIDAIESERAGETVTVDAEVTNDGGAVATDVPVAFDNGTDPVANASVDRIDPGETADVSATIDLASTNQSVPDRVVLDPDGELGADAVERADRPAWFLQPDLDIGDVDYVESNGTTTAEVLLANRGSASTDATIRIVDGEGDTLGESTEHVENASNASPTFTTVPVELDDVEEGTSVTVTATGDVPDATPSTTGTSDEVGPLLAGEGPTFEVAVTDVDRIEAGEVGSLEVEVKNRGQEADAQSVVLHAHGSEADRVDVELEPGERATETLAFETADGDHPSIDLRVASETAYDSVSAAVEPADDGPPGGGAPWPAPPADGDPASFAVDELDVPAAVDVDAPVPVTATIRNVGDDSGTAVVELRLDGKPVDDIEVALDGSASRTVDLEAIADLEPGEYELDVSAGDDRATTTVTVEAAGDGDPPDDPSGNDPSGNDPAGDDPVDEDGVPGFGVVVTVVAAILVVASGRRR